MLYRVIKSFLIKKSDPYYELGLERERTKPIVVRPKPWHFSGDEPKYVQKFKDDHSQTYDHDVIDSVNHYSQHGHKEINKHLLGHDMTEDDWSYYRENEVDPSPKKEIEAHIDSIDKGMEKSPTKTDIIVWRGLNLMFSEGDKQQHPLERRLLELGAVSEFYTVDYTKALKLKGFTFTEPNFISTTFNPKIADDFTNRLTIHLVCEIKVPAGTQAIYLPGAHRMDRALGIKDFVSHPGEVELLLDRGLKFRVTNVTSREVFKGYAGFIVHLDLVN